MTDERAPYVVGIGASAGGLEALERFFEKMPPGSGMAFVVIQHLSPDFKSLTDELLARRTSIPIHRVEDGMELRPDAIYLLPPRKDMILASGKLLLTDKDPAQLVTLPIDHFFRSLAQDAGDRAVGVVLSGTGSDGSRGIRDIHAAGGLVVVQAPETAKFDGMPNSALKSGVVDFVLPPEEIPGCLLRHARHPLAQDLPPETEPVPLSGMEAIYRLLRDSCGIDFTHYKPSTVFRRTERRLVLGGTQDIDEYARRLASDPDELNALYKDLLIGVTRFFRDKEAFDALERTVLPQLLPEAAPPGEDEEFRVWVAGCATGEEAYSLAILVQERLDRLPRPVSVKVFATDVHRASLETASVGAYDEEALAEVSPERVARFFVRKGDGYQVAPELRKLVVFAQHNVVKDAPFTKLDLVTCRNLLIYLQPQAQKKVLSLFHFGLRTGGVLLLGPSETPGDLGDEFEPIDARWRIYRKRRDVKLPTDIRLSAPLAPVRPRAPGGPVPQPAASAQLLATYDVLLDEYMPPSLLVNENNELVQVFGGANRYLRLREGRFSADVLELVNSDLRLPLNGALQRAGKDLQPVVYRGVRVNLPEGERAINLTVRPVVGRRPGASHCLISFEELGAPPALAGEAREVDAQEASREQMLSLETELRYTKENLQATIEELETSNEELQATNEELVAANEELQSTNEELHSVNEELYTVNAEYQKKIAELTELTADMDNLLVSTQVHTIFLDKGLRIRKFTPMIGETFSLLPQDVGRRIDSFTHTIDHPDLLGELREVLQAGELRERQVRDRRGRSYLLRVLPYRSGPAVEGVVLTLVDITNLKAAEAEAQEKDARLTAILRNSPNPVFITDRDNRFLLADESFQRLVGCDPVGKTPRELLPGEAADQLTAHNDRVLAEGVTVASEVVVAQEGGPHTYLSVKFPLRDQGGKVIGVGGIMTDVTALKRAEAEAREAVVHRERFLAMLSHELRNPLAAVLNATAIIAHLAGKPADGAAFPPGVLEWFQVIERRGRHMARLLDDLLDVTRLTQNKIEMRKQTFDLSTVMDDAVEEVRGAFADGRLELTVRKPDGPLLVHGDAARLQQMQVNLLRNAAKYTPPGGRVWYSAGREADRAVIRVRDTGVGIPANMLDKIFDLFVQVGAQPAELADRAGRVRLTGDRAGGGIGVGLTLVRSIVEQHGGRVEAYSAGLGQGSEFIVRLPLVSEGAAATRGGDGGAAAGGPSGKGRRILLVEDDPDIRESLQAILAFEGHEVRSVGEGGAALAALEQQRPEVVLLDIGLPDTDGYSVAREVRRRWPGGRPLLVALTGFGRASDRQAAMDAGFDAHLTKPVKPAELFRALDAAGAPEKEAAKSG